MKKLLALSLVVLLALTACPHNNKIDPNAPLELTVENLAGKWVLESDNSTWWEFSNNNFSNSGGDSGTFKIASKEKVLIEYHDSFTNTDKSEEYLIIVYKTYFLMHSSKDKYIKQ